MTRPLVLVLLVLASAVDAGGPGPDERRLVIGRCENAACVWDCNGAENPTCTSPDAQCALPPAQFAARLRFTVDDQMCNGQAGSKFTIALAGVKDSGASFTIPDMTFDLCGVPDTALQCGGTLGICEGGNIPRATVFLCTTFLPDGVLDESGIPDVTWLQYSNFLPPVAAALKQQFPGVPGEPFIADITEQSFTQDFGVLPSVREFCLTGAFIVPTGNVGVPAAIGSLTSTTTTASLDFGDCPTLPVVATTTTTLPGPGSPCATAADCDDGDPCTTDGCEAGSCVNPSLEAPAVIVCLVGADAASTCADDSLPAGFTKKRDKAAEQVRRALLKSRRGARRKLLGAARKLLTQAGKKIGHAKGVSDDCVASLQAGVARAKAFVDDAR